MDTTFLSKLLLRSSECKIKGIHVDDLPLSKGVVNETKKMLVVPPGLNKDLVRRFADSGAIVADHLDANYPEDSMDVFVKTVESVKPQLVVGGSRGTRLLACRVDVIVLFAPTRLREFFESRPTNTIPTNGSDSSDNSWNRTRTPISSKWIATIPCRT